MHKQPLQLGTGAIAALFLVSQAAAQGDVKTAPPAPPTKVAETAPLRAAAQPASTPAKRSAPAAAHDLFGGKVVVEGTDEGVWAAASGWKARFEDGRATFVPFFGSNKPRNAPITFRLESITAGGDAVAIAPTPVASLQGAAEAAVVAGERVTFERGAIDEAYALSSAGIEQLFTIESQAEGDVLVRIAVEGEYSGEPDDDGIVFTSELGSVRYGRAFAVDADGARIEIAETFDGAAIELAVPASFLATAAYPVTIDPLVSTFGVFLDADDVIAPDVAFAWGPAWYLHVAERVYSSTDSDVYSWMANDSGLMPDTLRIVDVSSTSWAHPRVAANIGSNNFVVVAEVGFAPFRDIRARTFEPSLVYDPPHFVSGSESGDKFNPTIGGYGSAVGQDKFLVVYERVYSATDHDVHARLLDDFGQTVGDVIAIDDSSETIDEKPAISKGVGDSYQDTQIWSIVWEREYSSADHDVYGAQVYRDGTIVHATFPIDTTTFDDRNPSVSSIVDGSAAERVYMCAWDRRYDASDRDIIAVAMLGAVLQSPKVNLSVLNGTSSRDQRTPSVDTDGRQFAIAYAEEDAPTDFDLFADVVWYADHQIDLSTSRMTLAATVYDENRPSMIAKHSAGAPLPRFCVAYGASIASGSDTYAAVFDIPVGGPVTSFCPGTIAGCPCGNAGAGHGGCSSSVNIAGGLLDATGHATVSDDDFVLHASGLPATAPCLFFQGTQQVNLGDGAPFGDGLRCVGGTVVRLATKTCVAGVASYPEGMEIPIATKGGLTDVGGVRYYQAWYRNAAAFCTSGTFNLTNGMRAVWTP